MLDLVFLGVFVAGTFITWGVTPWVMHMARRIGALDQPNHRKVHATTTPLLGGVGLVAGTWLPALAVGLGAPSLNLEWPDLWPMAAVLVLSLVAAGGGVLDDVKNLKALQKLAIQVPMALVFALAVARLDKFTLFGHTLIEFGWLSVPITVIWIVGIINAFNLIDGINGLAAGVGMICALTTGAVAVYTGNLGWATVMLALGGSCLGFLRHNFGRARIFLGDTGSLFLGSMFGMCSVLVSSKGALAASLIVPVIVLGYPILDTTLAILRRAILGKPIMSSDKAHVHHRLLALGLSHAQTSVVIYAFCIGLGWLAIGVATERPNHTLIASLFVVSAIGLAFHVLGLWKAFSPAHVRPMRRLLKAIYQSRDEFQNWLKASVDASPMVVAQRLVLAGEPLGVQAIRMRGHATSMPGWVAQWPPTAPDRDADLIFHLTGVDLEVWNFPPDTKPILASKTLPTENADSPTTEKAMHDLLLNEQRGVLAGLVQQVDHRLKKLQRSSVS